MFIKFTDDTRQGLLVSLIEDRIRIQNYLAKLDERSEKEIEYNSVGTHTHTVHTLRQE